MRNQEGRSVIRWYFEDVLGKGDLSQAENFISDNVVFHPLGLNRRSDFLDYVKVLRTAFPDLNFRVEDEMNTESRAAARFRMTGTHLGDFRGIPATGRGFIIEGMDFLHLDDGRITEIWVSLDTLDWMKQLGVVTLPG
jgi:steroid delta-isomerase-like uncharacterized protein